MKTSKFFLPLLVAATMIACGGNQKPKQTTAFNPGTSPEEKVDSEREAKLEAKKAAFNAVQNPMENLHTFEGKIKLTVMVPNDGLSVNESKQLEMKMIQMVTANGIGGLGGNPRFIIAPDVNNLKKEVTSTAPVRHMVTCEITFYVADMITGTIFGSSSVKATGVGDSETLAFLAAFNDLKPTDASFQAMLEDAQGKIISYYEANGANMINEAKMLAAKGEYSQAMALLGSIPTEVGDVYTQAIAVMEECLQKYLDKECGLALSQFKAALGNAKNGVNKEAMAYYAMIPANSPCKAEANELYNAYRAKLSAEDQREWERESEKIKADNEFRTLQENLQAKIQITGNKCLLDKYKKEAAYDRLPWIRKVIYLGDHDPFDGYTPEEEC